jgi:hypothetical protein
MQSPITPATANSSQSFDYYSSSGMYGFGGSPPSVLQPERELDEEQKGIDDASKRKKV